MNYEEIMSLRDSCKENPFLVPIKIVYPTTVESKKRNSKKSDDDWRATKKQWKPIGPEHESLKKVNSILNKLSIDNFDKLCQEFLGIDDTSDILEDIVTCIFNKAVMEPHFGEIYSKLCVIFGNFNVNFRRHLLNKCQAEFQNTNRFDQILREESEASGNPELLREIASRKQKQKLIMTGNIIFIGQLFKFQMISEPIIHSCIAKFAIDLADEDSIECVCKLIEITGSSIKAPLDRYFEVLRRMSDNKERYGSRHRFMIKDLVDLRSRNWVSKKKQPLKMTQ